MSNSPRRETAKIYRFPSRLRIAATDLPQGGRPDAVRMFPACEAGSGWYHDAAIQDEQRDRKS